MSFEVFSVEVSRDTVVTAPNAISAAGYALVHDGIRRGITTPLGITEVGAGRIADLADGYVARAIGQSSEFGAFWDAGLDKKASQEIMDAVSEEDLIPEVLDDAIRSHNTANAALTLLTKILRPNEGLTPSISGKRFMFGTGVMAGTYALSETVAKTEWGENHPRTAKAIRYAGHIAGAAGTFYYGTKATNGYFRRLLKGS